ncbi:hypothetical protein DV735_g5622, partial [Chaetothyriales sp. CBS 134920]
MPPINPTPMATVHIGVGPDPSPSPSPPLSKFGLVPSSLPPSSSPVRLFPSSPPASSSPVRLSPSPALRLAAPSPSSPHSPTRSRSQPDFRADQLDALTDEGMATSLRMPVRIKAGPPSSVPPSYLGHDHGTPLSDIGEEESTPGSKAGRRSSGMAPLEPDSPSQPPSSPLGHKSRQSIQSLSGSSDVGDWENFDPSKMMTGRLAAERTSIVTLTNGADTDELAILNAKAERILASARERLTTMEDNLSKARNSMFLNDQVLSSLRGSPSMSELRSSPSMSELHQPAGGLYRSISLASRKTKPLHLVSRTQQQVHSRGSSDTSPNNKLKTLSMVPEIRASSAQEYRRRYESPHPPTPTFPRFMRVNGQSPTSSRSVNSPVREDQEESPSTVKTSPESPYSRGLGINTMARTTKEDVSMTFAASSPSLPSAPRTVSSGSTGSIRDQGTDAKADLPPARMDKERAVSYGSRSTPSPFMNSSNPERWYVSAPEYKGGSPLNVNAGVGWSPVNETKFKLSPVVTPQTQKFLDGENLPSTGETARFDIRTDVNTPNLAKHSALQGAEDGPSTAGSVVPESLYEDAAQGFDDQVAASDEEQIYLNEVLEESLQEVEPDGPDVAEDFFYAQEGTERHEDRLDAFDYENMFLHSALGNFGGTNYRYKAGEYEDGSDDGIDRSTTPTQYDVGDGLPTPTRSDHPQASLWVKHPQRSQSVESVSTLASFATATEGDAVHDRDGGDDQVPDEILKWGNEPAFPSPRFVLSPIPYSAPSSGRPTPVLRGLGSPIRVNGPVHSPASPGFAKSPKAGSGVGIAHYHLAATPPAGLTNGHTGAASASSSPPRNTSVIIHHRFSPPPLPLSAAGHQYASVTPPLASPYSPQPPMSISTPAQAQQQLQSRSQQLSSPGPNQSRSQQLSSPGPNQSHPANTEILMESLIKLADPDFRVQALGVKFADIDKDLVLSLLRAVGTVCDGVLKADKAGRQDHVDALRGQLEWGRRVLEGEGLPLLNHTSP